MGCTCGRPCTVCAGWTLTSTPTTTSTQTATIKITPQCEDCVAPAPHEGGWLAVVDEWFHRHHRFPLWVYRPLCNWRETRLSGQPWGH